MNQAEKNVDQRQFEKVVDKVLCLKMMRFKLWLWFSVKKKIYQNGKVLRDIGEDVGI